MADPENFEDDLFADLYEENDTSAPAPAPAPAAAPAPAPAIVSSQPVQPPMPEAQYGASAPDSDMRADDGGHGDEYQDDGYDDDDDVDFNLGNDSTTMANSNNNNNSFAAPPPFQDTPTPNFHNPRSSGAKEDGKMFIGGLNWETTDQSLRDYFSQFGEVTECTVMRDGASGRSRGFGFLTFRDPKTVNIVMVKEHFLDGKIIDPKRAIPRDEQEKTSKIFVGGVSQDTTEAEFKDYFAQFGRVVDATLMMDKDTGRPRGFGFVTFESDAGVEACLNQPLEINGKAIEVKKAQPRTNLREEEEANRRGGKFRKGGGDEQVANQNPMGSQGVQGGMTPQVMAQYMQRMQQCMAMMQQQVAMSRGMGMSGMNPAMMQAMQMQQMQQMQQQMQQQGQGQNNPMANMSPQMLQQMMAAQAQGGGQDGGDQQQGFSNYNQGQQMFNNQRGGGRRGGRGGGHGGYGNQNYGGGGGGGGMGGDPTSWEGMYDDVPQPNYNQGGGRGGFRNRGGGGHHQGSESSDPEHAPPANAPTGPKNAGRPGANYRGGGRGSNRGFHPYGR